MGITRLPKCYRFHSFVVLETVSFKNINISYIFGSIRILNYCFIIALILTLKGLYVKRNKVSACSCYLSKNRRNNFKKFKRFYFLCSSLNYRCTNKKIEHFNTCLLKIQNIFFSKSVPH